MSNTTNNTATSDSRHTRQLELLDKYRQFSPLETRDKPMITDLEQQIANLNKEQIKHLAEQLTTIHEQYRIHTEKTNELEASYTTASKLKNDIKQAEHASLSRNKSYQETLATETSARRLSNWMSILAIVLALVLLIVVIWFC